MVPMKFLSLSYGEFERFYGAIKDLVGSYRVLIEIVSQLLRLLRGFKDLEWFYGVGKSCRLIQWVPNGIYVILRESPRGHKGS